MTDEEKSEIEFEKINKEYFDFESIYYDKIKKGVKQAHIDGLAEGRKEIFPSFTKKKEMLETKVSILEEENEQLKAQKVNVKDKKCRNCVRMTVSQDEYINIMEEQCRDYEEQIERMKCCDNCKHVKYDWDDQLRIGKCKTCESLSNWEIRE